MLQSNQKAYGALYTQKAMSPRRRWGAISNAPSSPLQSILGDQPPVSKIGAPTDVGSSQPGMRPNPNLAAKELAGTLVSRQHAAASVKMLAQEASRLSHTEQLELAALLIQNVGAPIPAQAARRPTSTKRHISRDREMRWLAENRNEYVGQWVVVEGDRLIASGPDSREVFQAAKQAGIQIPFLVHVEPENQLPFGGW